MIYETHGRAQEYFELAANLYSGCEHACLSCYGPDVVHKTREDFTRRGIPRPRALAELEADAKHYAKRGERRHILLSFVTDPYQPSEEEFHLTHEAIKILHKYGLFAAILTKGGYRATHDFDILTPLDLFGQSLTCHNPATWQYWEPHTSKPEDRIDVFKIAKDAGLQTFASCEPVYNAAETLELIQYASPWVDVFKVGTLNYRPEARSVDWKKFAQDAVALLDSLGNSYYIKKDLARFIGKPDGITKGNVPK